MRTSLRVFLVVGLVATFTLPAFAQRRRSGSSGGGSSSGTAQPTTPTVNPQLMQARSARDKAQADLDKLTAKLTADYEAGDEYTAAKKALASATDAVTAAKAPVLDALKDSPDYKAALDDEAQAAKKLKDLKDNDAPRTQVNAANDELFKKAAVKGKLESQALASDPGMKAAQAAAQTAKENLAKLKSTFHDSLKDNPDYVAAKKALDDAQTKVASMMPKPATGGPSAQGGN